MLCNNIFRLTRLGVALAADVVGGAPDGVSQRPQRALADEFAFDVSGCAVPGRLVQHGEPGRPPGPPPVDVQLLRGVLEQSEDRRPVAGFRCIGESVTCRYDAVELRCGVKDSAPDEFGRSVGGHETTKRRSAFRKSLLG